MDIKELIELKNELRNGLNNENGMSLKTLKDIVNKVIHTIDLIILNDFESNDNEQSTEIESLKNLLEIEKKEVDGYSRGIDALQNFIKCMIEDLGGNNNSDFNSDFKSGMICILRLMTRQLDNI
ncbi:MAG: hypothetical protein JXB50_07990 [Spirochaetes bacterium]|nr:hypothetical protein [Spirochaetota bacterium]